MPKVIQIIYAAIGLFFLGLSILGVLLPVLPTTPFLLVSFFFFTKSSTRMQNWFHSTRLYRKYLHGYLEKNGMTARQKFSLILFSDLMLAYPFFRYDILYLRVAIVIIDLVKYWYLLFVVRTIKNG